MTEGIHHPFHGRAFLQQGGTASLGQRHGNRIKDLRGRAGKLAVGPPHAAIRQFCPANLGRHERSLAFRFLDRADERLQFGGVGSVGD